jgi:hypothetical protein
MRPLFTIHAGELIVGEYIEKRFSTLNIWLPSRDTGIDLLVTNADASKAVSLQVKLSRDYKDTYPDAELHECLTSAGWVTIDDKKLAASSAQFWVFVLLCQDRRSRPQFLIISPAALRSRLAAVHAQAKAYQFYPWVMTSSHCIHGRSLSKQESKLIPSGQLPAGDRDFSQFLNNWQPLNAIT